VSRTIIIETTWTYHGDDDDEDMVVRCQVTPPVKGRTYGDPDQCYPPEPAEVDVLKVWEDNRGRKDRPELVAVANEDKDLYEAVVDELAQLERDYD